VETATHAEGEADYPPDLIIAAYEQLQSVIEACGSSLSKLLVFLRAEPGLLSLRLLLQAEDFTLKEVSGTAGKRGFRQTVSVTKNGSDLLLVFHYQEGGDAS